ncbi:RAQPRD family integrative conjugative element protein [Pseudomonas sp. GD03858]|uniref:integrative conjugative element protein, RAQPRD family n=1 Tax=unclassified Pseudomonas TaxID=196821 RepID=UPI0024478276|nr:MULTISPECIES: RAQPRD family integrative conjugative element protein [unclassified Pseudomonas]MDH0648670.1 RAQPRD family integrative conjugative element protein [Pseudomonas sp. GD03867]MDH0660785.1 RAQPRD family integrative conjugative element protein [Pseudomonas sp. GD03858]
MRTCAFPLLVICLVTLPAVAQESRERSDLGLVQRQFTAIEQLAVRAKSGSEDIDGARYRFDYLRFSADLQRVREGIYNYLSPSRAQPADLVELTDQYRAETPHAGSSDEHD